MNNKYNIPVYKPDLSGNEKKYVNECLDSSWISSRGDFVTQFEEEFKNYINAEKATTVSNGTVALHLALYALGIKEGDEVILPSLTYVASANSVAYVGATPVFADSDIETWNIDKKSIVSKITPKTKAIMVVHLYGNSCDMDGVKEICQKHNLLLIEDAAEAFGTRYKNDHVGTFGDISTFSFFGNKTITTGEGGMIVSNNSELIERCSYLKSQAVSLRKEYWHDEIGFNYRMTNVCAAIGLAQLERAEKTISLKRELVNQYKADLNDCPVTFQKDEPGSFNSFWMSSIVVNDSDQRDKLRELLKRHGIETRPFFPLMHSLPAFRSSMSLPNAEKLEKSGINLPSYPLLSSDEVSYITDKIKSFFGK